MKIVRQTLILFILLSLNILICLIKADESPLKKLIKTEHDNAVSFELSMKNYKEIQLRNKISNWIDSKINEGYTKFRHIPADLFMLTNKKSRALIIEEFEEKIRNHVKFQLKPVINLPKFGDWRDEVVSWYNSWCEPSVDAFKKPHLYLWGKSDYGKTVFINRLLLRGVPDNSIYLLHHPHNGRFTDASWRELNYGIHALVYKDHFIMNTNFNNEFKRLLQGVTFKDIGWVLINLS